ncbi:MAG: sigma 54-interacting transcriptional regulator, partial [Verrucomicrobiota bacterium]
MFSRTRGGTVHLAEIHHLPMRIQAQLNGLLEQAATTTPNSFNGAYNFRLITSTTMHLEDAIREGRFREDLYYKLSVVPVNVPPL